MFKQNGQTWSVLESIYVYSMYIDTFAYTGVNVFISCRNFHTQLKMISWESRTMFV